MFHFAVLYNKQRQINLLTHFEHFFDGRDGFFGCLFWYYHFGIFVQEAVIHFFKRIHAHIFTLVA